MFNWLRPLRVELLLQGHPYRLGETINLAVELHARGPVHIREGRVDLVCQGRWVEVYTLMVPVYPRLMPQIRGMTESLRKERVPKQVTEDVKASYVHSSVVFGADDRLAAGDIARYTVSLETRPARPRHVPAARLRWLLIAWVDVAGARNVSSRRLVTVALPGGADNL
ncbi:MAG: hypothetical protein HYY00_00250 [Chloroflexi bacterium]|nr:hypothetical protein [Chloroflexota bacterium]